MLATTSQRRHTFVRYIKQNSEVALLDFTRDDYRTVIIACVTELACLRARSVAVRTGYTVATTWTIATDHYIVFTTPDSTTSLQDSAAPPDYIVERGKAFVADTPYTR